MGRLRRLEGHALKVSLVLVAHRSSAVLAEAVASFRREAHAAQLEAEVLVVEQSECEEELERVRGCRPDHLLVRPNRGYAAGLNTGIAVASGEVLVLGNPDVVFRQGSVAALLAALASGWSLVGPQFMLGPFLLPPADEQTPRQELARRLAANSPGRRRRFLVREIGRWRRVWDSDDTVEVPVLSGALLAVRAETARRVGPWDERYFLYFEEMDWQRRAAGLGLRVAVAPRSRVVHRWGHAAEPAAYRPVFERSRRLYFERWFGWRGRAALALPLRPSIPSARPVHLEALAPGERLWLVSPSPLGFPAAGARISAAELAPALARLAGDSAWAHEWYVLDGETLDRDPAVWSSREDVSSP